VEKFRKDQEKIHTNTHGCLFNKKLSEDRAVGK